MFLAASLAWALVAVFPTAASVDSEATIYQPAKEEGRNNKEGRRLTYSGLVARPGVVDCALVTCLDLNAAQPGNLDTKADWPEGLTPSQLCSLSSNGAAVIQASVPMSCLTTGGCPVRDAASAKLKDNATAREVVNHMASASVQEKQKKMDGEDHDSSINGQEWAQYGAVKADGSPGAAFTGKNVSECYSGTKGPFRDGCLTDSESGSHKGWSYSFQGNVLTKDPQGSSRRRHSPHVTVVDFGKSALLDKASKLVGKPDDLTCRAGQLLIEAMLHGPESGGHGDTRCTSNNHHVAGSMGLLRIAEVNDAGLHHSVDLFVGSNEMGDEEGAEDVLRAKWEQGVREGRWCEELADSYPYVATSAAPTTGNPTTEAPRPRCVSVSGQTLRRVKQLGMTAVQCDRSNLED